MLLDTEEIFAQEDMKKNKNKKNTEHTAELNW